MTIVEIAVTPAGVAIITFLEWYFFGPKQARSARLRGNVQEVEVTVSERA